MSDPETLQSDMLGGFPVQAYEDLLVSVFPSLDPSAPVLGVTDEVEMASHVSALLHDESLVVASLGDNGQLIGCSLATPVDRMDPSRASEARDTAYIYFTAIDPKRQGEGLVGPLMETLLQKLWRAGYSFVERDCVIANGYADNVQQTYRGAIVESYDHTNFPEAGPERFFRIDLGRLAIK